MEKVAVLKNEDEVISNIFNFVENSNFNEFTTLSKMRELIRNHFVSAFQDMNEPEIKNYAKKIKSFNFYKKENYNVTNKNEDVYELMNNLSNFRDEIVHYIDLNYNDDNQNRHKLERKVSPPLEAYEYVGHSKLKITPTGKDFGLIFE